MFFIWDLVVSGSWPLVPGGGVVFRELGLVEGSIGTPVVGIPLGGFLLWVLHTFITAIKRLWKIPVTESPELITKSCKYSRLGIALCIENQEIFPIIINIYI